MAESNMLKTVELRLLRCTISDCSSPASPEPNHEDPFNSLTFNILATIERGDYTAALSSDAARLVFSFANSWEYENSAASAALFYGEVENSIDAFLCEAAAENPWPGIFNERADANTEHRVALLLCIGVASLFAFMQQNVTGPVEKVSRFPLPFQYPLKDGDAESTCQWDLWARSQLTTVGCDLLGKFTSLQYLEYAKIVLMKVEDLCKARESGGIGFAKTTSLWLCRLFILQQRILEDLSSSLYDILQAFKTTNFLQFGEEKNVIDYWSTMLHEKEALTIASMVQVEAGVIEYYYGRIDSSRLHLAHAAEITGMDISVTGILGYRTIYQMDAKPQLVLVSNASQLNGSLDDSISLNKLDLESNGHRECDILMSPRLMQNENVAGSDGGFGIIGKDVMLTSIQQAIVLAQCLHLQRSKRDDELSRWEMAPYIEAIDSQNQSCYIITCSCDILRVRWESIRSRTKQRALLMMDKLAEAVFEPLPVAAQRIQLAFCVYLLTIPALRKEYGELSVACGMVGEALRTFEDLELWDNLIYCYRLLDKKTAAVELINARLREAPADPKLWCSLGDVTSNDECYEKALQVSNNKSARAMRSLARSAYNRGDYEKAMSLWESAMAINSLYVDGWFALGAAALKARHTDKAIDGFTRAVQLDPENGEAWNNVACLHMINKKSKAAFIAFKEALKFRRNSWQLWENFSHVAVDIGNYCQALEGLKMVLDLSSNKQVDIELLDKILIKIEEFSSRKDQDICTTSNKDLENIAPMIEEREKELLVSTIGSVLHQVIKSGGGGGEIWGLYARWQKMEGHLDMCSEALLKQVRAYQSSDVWHNFERFKKFARASLQLCNVYMEMASSGGTSREIFAAEMHLRNSVKQAVNFSDTEEYRDLQDCLNAIKKQLDSSNIS